MVSRSRLHRTQAHLGKNRLKTLSLEKKKLYTLRLDGAKIPVGFIGRNPKWKEIITDRPPYYKVLLSPAVGQYVRIDWKKNIVYDILGKPMGKLPKKLKWDKYVPVLPIGKHPMTISERESFLVRKEARKLNKRALAGKTMREAGIEILPKRSLGERLSLENLKREIP